MPQHRLFNFITAPTPQGTALLTRLGPGAPWIQAAWTANPHQKIEWFDRRYFIVFETERMIADAVSCRWSYVQTAIMPMFGHVWQHKYSGTRFIIEGIANLDDQWIEPTRMILRRESNGQHYAPEMRLFLEDWRFLCDTMHTIRRKSEREWWTKDYRKKED